MTAIRYLIPLLVVAFFILVVMLAQGIGTQLGGGVQEWLIP